MSNRSVETNTAEQIRLSEKDSIVAGGWARLTRRMIDHYGAGKHREELLVGRVIRGPLVSIEGSDSAEERRLVHHMNEVVLIEQNGEEMEAPKPPLILDLNYTGMEQELKPLEVPLDTPREEVLLLAKAA